MSFLRRHPVIVISVITAVVAVSGTTAWAISYDHRSAHTLQPGTVVGGVPVAGLTEAQAVSAVRARVEDPLHRPIEVRGADAFDARTTAWDLGLRVDVPAAVHRAMQRSQEGNMVQRVWRRLFGHPSSAVNVRPAWGHGEVSALLDKAAESVNLEAKDAKVDTSSGFVNIVAPRTGRQLDVERSRAAVLDAATSGKSSVELVANQVAPKVGAEAVRKVILVRTGENMLYLYEGGKITKQYPVATGQAVFPTPAGTWRIISKLVNPVWINPHSDWSANMPATIGPGPNNPLGTRALALNASGILIHATSDTSSIGYSASHGCIRMNPSDEEDLFGRVDAGTIVAIVNAGPAKPRPPAGAAPVTTPDQSAAVNY